MRLPNGCGLRIGKNAMRSNTATTVASGLLSGAARLLQAGVKDHRQEAVRIWADLRDQSPAEAWLLRHDPISGVDHARFSDAVDRRCAGEPVQYITGKAAFRHLTLDVDSRVLIPRPETEGLVDIVLEWTTQHTGPAAPRVLEIGVGSGCIILSLAVEGNFAGLVGTDDSQDALAVAEANRAKICQEKTIEFRRGSFFAPVRGEKFDVLISNPPYVSAHEYTRLDSGVRNFEPREALVSGETGLRHTQTICEGAPDIISPGGLVVLEIDARRHHESLAIAHAAGLTPAEIRKDLFGRHRYLIARVPEARSN